MKPRWEDGAKNPLRDPNQKNARSPLFRSEKGGNDASQEVRPIPGKN